MMKCLIKKKLCVHEGPENEQKQICVEAVKCRQLYKWCWYLLSDLLYFIAFCKVLVSLFFLGLTFCQMMVLV